MSFGHFKFTWTVHKFHESHPAFTGFSEFYHKEIFPQLAAWEGKRKRTSFFTAPALILSSAICAFLIYWLVQTNPGRLTGYGVGLIIILINPLAVYRYFFRSFSHEVKDFLVGKVCSFTGLQYSRKSKISAPINAFSDYRFFPRGYRFSRFEDHMKGTSRSINFHIFEVHGESGNQKSPKIHTSTVFKFELPHFSGNHVLVLRKADRKPAPKYNLKSVGFAAPPFSHLFEVYGNDQVMSRVILHPVFLERILYAENVIDGINARFAFTGQELWVTVETANRFEQGSMWIQFVNPRRTQQLIWEISSVLYIVDALIDLLSPERRTPPPIAQTARRNA